MIPFTPEIVRSWIDVCRKRGLKIVFPERNPDIYQPSPMVKQMLCGIKYSRQGVKRPAVKCERCAKHYATYKFNEGNGVFSLFCSECRMALIDGADDRTRQRWHSL